MEDNPGPSFKCCSMCMRHCFETHRNFMRSESEALFASPAFFRVIRKSHVTGSKFLRIPVLFMENLNYSIGDKLNLRGPSGFECVVTVKRHGKGYVLQGGFDQFMTSHDVDVGDSLVLTLVADSSFLIKVFDKCGSEKTCSTKWQDNVTEHEAVPRLREVNRECRLGSKECQRENDLEDGNDTGSGEESVDRMLRQKRKVVGARLKADTDQHLCSKSSKAEEQQELNASTQRQTYSSKSKRCKQQEGFFHQLVENLAQQEDGEDFPLEDKALDSHDVSYNVSSLGDTREGSSNMAGDLATRNKLQVNMHKGSRSNGEKNEEEDIQSARCSSVKTSELLTKHTPPAPKAKDTSAQVLDSPRPTEHLTNSPARSGQKRKQSAKTGKHQKVDCLRNAARPLMDSLKNPYQFCIMTNSHVNTHYTVYLNKLQLPETSTPLTLLDSADSQAGQYTVSWIVTPRSHPRLGSGWKQFVMDHEIEVGDACVFERNTQYMLTVHIFRLKHYWKPTRWDDLPPKESGRSTGETFNFHPVKEEDKTSGKMTTPSVANSQAAPSSPISGDSN